MSEIAPQIAAESVTLTEAGSVCLTCGHAHTPDGCTGEPTPSDIWAGVSVETCDCDEGGAR